MVTVIIFVLLTMVIAYFIVLPIIQSKMKVGQWDSQQSNHQAIELVERKENIYAAIKEIEFDYQMGKLSDEDFQELRQQYKQEAIGLLQKIDNIQIKKVSAHKMQADQKRRQKGGNEAVNFCWLCGTAIVESDKFCANCGNKL